MKKVAEYSTLFLKKKHFVLNELRTQPKKNDPCDIKCMKTAHVQRNVQGIYQHILDIVNPDVIRSIPWDFLILDSLRCTWGHPGTPPSSCKSMRL